MPRRHVPGLLELRPYELTEFVHFARYVTDQLLRIYRANAFNWSIQEHEAAGQTVAHLHLHILPRHTHDLPRPGDWYPQLLRTYQFQDIDSDDRTRLSLAEQHALASWLRARWPR